MCKMYQKKQIFKIEVLKKLLTDKNNCVSLVPTTRVLALPPFFLNDMKSGIFYLLNNSLKKYDRALNGILIGYQNIKVLMDENTGIIQIGTAETEVNISVEFYIFQPKIGSYLEGVINKKSKNHIGCLVHKYFNATILKPEDIEFEDWVCKDCNVDDRILFKVKDLDFTGVLPYIEGVVTEEFFNKNKEYECDMVKKVKDTVSKKGKSCQDKHKEEKDVSNIFNNHDSSERKIQKWNINGEEEEEEEENSCSELNDNVIKLIAESLDEIDFLKDEKKTKKKKKEHEKYSTITESQTEDEVNGSSQLDKNSKTEDLNESDYFPHKKKKRKKDKKENESTLHNIQDVVLENHLPKDVRVKKSDEVDSKVFGKSIKKEKRNKQSKDESALRKNNKKVNECLTPGEKEQGIFHSTQLEPSKESELFPMSFCSPILPEANPEKRKEKKRTTQPTLLDNLFHLKEDKKKKESLNSLEKTKDKKKDKKRKRNEEEDLESSVPAKKAKKENSLDFGLLSTKKEESKPEKTSRKSSHHKKNKKEDEKSKTTEQSLIEKIYQEQMSRIKERWGTSNEEASDFEPKLVKKVTKSPSKKKEAQEKKSETSLYEKLLEEARNSINSENFLSNQPSTLSKKKDESNSKTNLERKKKKEGKNKSNSENIVNNQKGSKTENEDKVNVLVKPDNLERKRKRKKEEEPETSPSKKLKMKTNCNASPIFKANEDKNFFSGSETSGKSNLTKKEKIKVNGEVEYSHQAEVQRILDKVCKEKLGNISDLKISVKEETKKSKSKPSKPSTDVETKSQSTNQSLFEKLLKDVRESLNLKAEDGHRIVSKSEKKKEKKEKNDLKKRKSLKVNATSLF